MATKKKSIAFELQTVTPGPCKTKCGRRASIEGGWCSICFAKHKKGYYTENGSLSPEIERKLRKLAEKRRLRDIRRKEKDLNAIKSSLKAGLTPAHLKTLPVIQPDAGNQFYCDKLSFWTTNIICYSRLFVSQNKKCLKCKVHDDSLTPLVEFMEKYNAEATETAAAQNNIETDAGATTTPGGDQGQ